MTTVLAALDLTNAVEHAQHSEQCGMRGFGGYVFDVSAICFGKVTKPCRSAFLFVGMSATT
jgi:hypothetical protein